MFIFLTHCMHKEESKDQTTAMKSLALLCDGGTTQARPALHHPLSPRYKSPCRRVPAGEPRYRSGATRQKLCGVVSSWSSLLDVRFWLSLSLPSGANSTLTNFYPTNEVSSPASFPRFVHMPVFSSHWSQHMGPLQ